MIVDYAAAQLSKDNNVLIIIKRQLIVSNCVERSPVVKELIMINE